MKKRILSILLALCMLFCLVPTTAFAADCAEDLVDPVIWIHLSSDGGGYYDVLNVLYPIRCKTLLDGGRRRTKNLYGVFKRTVPAGQVRQ